MSSHTLTDLTGNIEIRDSSRYQFLYASQNYGTFYCIFAKITLKSNKYLDTIKFKLINYKGLVNMGFFGTEGEEITVEINNNELQIKIIVGGLKKDNETTFTVSSGLKLDISNIKYIVFNRLLRKLHEHGCANGLVFDDEFFYRSGIMPPEPRLYRKGMENDGIILKGGPSGECHTAILKII